MKLKLCINCKHILTRYGAHCSHPETFQQASPVDGENHMEYCAVVRLASGKCGPEGKLYEEREQAVI